MAWGLTVPVGDIGADIVAGELQSFGNSQNYGGPLVGFMATRQEYVRNLPGRLAGQTVDAQGRRGFVVVLDLLRDPAIGEVKPIHLVRLRQGRGTQQT